MAGRIPQSGYSGYETQEQKKRRLRSVIIKASGTVERKQESRAEKEKTDEEKPKYTQGGDGICRDEKKLSEGD